MRNLFVDTMLLISLICYATATTGVSYSFKLRGIVKDDKGRGIPNVVVNDGVHFTVTDKDGVWKLESDSTESKFIAISTPADYELPQKDELATGFYIPIKKAVRTEINEFSLKKRKRKTDAFGHK